MKKVKLILMASILLCLSSQAAIAQLPYKASVGGTLGFMGVGPSFKTFLTDNISIQTDLLYKATLTGVMSETYFGLASYVSLELNANVMYQKKIKEKEKSELFWFIGGGLSLGSEVISGINGKFGANAIVGIEYLFKNKPLAFQIDFRPGYGMLFNSGHILNGDWFHPETNPWSHFDWYLGFTWRYVFKEKL